ncbi:hypothetical protein [Micromonospora sp. KLBMP9576]|uniref:hypothetical protein n=1 Tax=Micromonospora sp. KLBMP9576 TaxID=3424769 RepID=UPI003D8A3D61
MNREPAPARRGFRRSVAAIASIACAVAVLPGPARADNPIVQNIHTADPAPMAHNGRVYVYTGHDEDNFTSYAAEHDPARGVAGDL